MTATTTAINPDIIFFFIYSLASFLFWYGHDLSINHPLTGASLLALPWRLRDLCPAILGSLQTAWKKPTQPNQYNLN
jgi:hypothetical protein